MVYRYAISSHSLGRAWVHELSDKLDQAAAYDYEGIEMFYEDLEYLARSLPGGLTDENQLEAARQIHKMCQDRHLSVIVLQPFLHYEGLLDREEHASRIEKLNLWFKIVKILETDLIQIPSNFLPPDQITDDMEVIVKDLRKVADLGLLQSPPVRFAYESLCWGTYIDTWEQCWNIVSAVDRPNFGMCLDTFNIAGRAWADPVSVDGKVRDADELFKQSMEKLRTTVDVRKVFYVQIVDAEKLREPLKPGHSYFIENQKPRMSWSRNARLFAFEKPGYLPIMDVLHAITDVNGLNYDGWISAELFSRTMNDPASDCPSEHARRGKDSWEKLVKVMNWEQRVRQGHLSCNPEFQPNL